MNKIVATLLSLLLLASCGLQRFGPPLSYERRVQNARINEEWYVRCAYEDACLGTRVTIPEAHPLVVVSAREMPRSSPFEDLSTSRITTRGVELRLHNQASTDVPLIIALEFPERPRPTLASDS